MARDHARLLVSIWDDEEFVALDAGTQVTYLSLISSRDLSWCGVAPLLPKRIARNSADGSERKVRNALNRLERDRFLVLDQATDEVLVRSYMRHDGILKQPNVTKALVRALNSVRSRSLRDAAKAELARLLGDDPDLRGWAVIRSTWPDLFRELIDMASANPSSNPSAKG